MEKQCVALKKEIYQRWEKSILRRNDFSPTTTLTFEAVLEQSEAKKETVRDPCSQQIGSEGTTSSLGFPHHLVVHGLWNRMPLFCRLFVSGLCSYRSARAPLGWTRYLGTLTPARDSRNSPLRFTSHLGFHRLHSLLHESLPQLASPLHLSSRVPSSQPLRPSHSATRGRAAHRIWLLQQRWVGAQQQQQQQQHHHQQRQGCR